MAGRKSKTAAAGKPKSKAKAGAKQAAEKGKSARPANKAKRLTAKSADKSAASKKSDTKKALKKRASKKSVTKKAVTKTTITKKAAAKKAPKPSSAKKSKAGGVRAPQKQPSKKAASKSKTPSLSETAALQTKGREVKLHVELERLSAYIEAARNDITALRPHDVKEEFLPKATDELDAIVEATADATNTIMDSCELVEGVMGDVSADVSNVLMDATTRIYEACTFQDITGQRISKVVGALKQIEDRIDAMLALYDDDMDGVARLPAPKTEQKDKKELTDEDLLEGPQLGDKAKSQAEIDDLLASFD